MSRVAKKPILIPSNAKVDIADGCISASGPLGSQKMKINAEVSVERESDQLKISSAAGKSAGAMAGTMRALIDNMVVGVTKGFEKRLTLIGVGYRAQMQGNALNLTLGYSHPIDFTVPEDISIETPSQTEVVVKGSDKQLVGQVAANIRAYRPPEPYKGKGVRYSDEFVAKKEAKKK